ncbi:ectonucleotide pyrophosphatase/phosphodiesterase [Lysobacter fragariae]
MFAWLLALFVSACASTPPAHTDVPDSLLLVSLDGFRADYLERGLTPNLSHLASTGVRAQWMNPSYPTLTFPNHYTLVTGLRPDHHGIVHNTMTDPALGEFKSNSTRAVQEPRWWGGEPIWVGAERAGLRTATLFWPGSEAAIGGIHPRQWLPYDDAMTSGQRVARVLAWLDTPAARRPRLATLYLSVLDHVGHDAGPDAAVTRTAIADVDAAVGRLLDGLASARLRDHVNVVIVSDHGMATVPTGNTLAVEGFVPPTYATVVTTGEVIGFQPVPGRTSEAEANLLGRHEHYECWRKGEMPPRWHYGTHPRIPPIVCQMDVGWEAVPREWLSRPRYGMEYGAHGFAPESMEMRAIFIANGPAFRAGAVLPAFDNVDVYPLLARLLGIAPQPSDGDASTLEAALAH